MLDTLADYRYLRKRRAANYENGHLIEMALDKKRLRKQPKSVLQALFIKRVWEELGERGLSPNALSQRPGGPAQKTLDDALAGSDPRLKTVSEIAVALGIQPWELLMERSDVGRRHGTVTPFPQPPVIIKKTLRATATRALARRKSKV